MIITPESKIQQQAFEEFNNKYCLANHNPRLLIHSVPNGISTGDPKILDHLNKTGMVKGVADLLIHLPNGKCLHAECKTSTGVQSKEQKEIQSRIESLGGIYFIFRNIDEFWQNVNKHLKL